MVDNDSTHGQLHPLELLVADERAPRIVAKTIYRLLKDGGAAHRQVLTIATELLSLVTQDLRRVA